MHNQRVSVNYAQFNSFAIASVFFSFRLSCFSIIFTKSFVLAFRVWPLSTQESLSSRAQYLKLKFADLRKKSIIFNWIHNNWICMWYIYEFAFAVNIMDSIDCNYILGNLKADFS